MKKTLVLGASDNPQRYSYVAIKKLRAHGHDVAAVGKKTAVVGDVIVNTDMQNLDDIDTVTLYLNPANQKPHYEAILALQPKRIIFNPGTENPELEEMANQKGIDTLEACTLVMLTTNQY